MNSAKSVSVTFTVQDFKRIVTPLDHKGYRGFMCIVDVQDLPDFSKWGKSNVRDPKGRGKVPGLIRAGLIENDLFVYMNRGLVIVAESVSFDNKHDRVTVRLSQPGVHGLIDGGHSHLIISQEKSGLLEKEQSNGGPVQQWVKVELLVGFNLSEVRDIAGARNTSNQVQDESLLNLVNRFDDLKVTLNDQAYADEIAYKEWETKPDGTPKPIDVRDIISIMYMFDTDSFKAQKHPVNAYQKKSLCLAHFKDKTDPEKNNGANPYQKLYHLLPELLRLHDEVYRVLPDLYDSARKTLDNKERGVFLNLKGVVNRPETLPFSGQKVRCRVPAGFVSPIVGAFRAFLEERNGQYNWIKGCDPFRLLRGDMGLQMAQALGNAAREDRNPSKTGKNQSLWHSCYQAAVIARQEIEIANLTKRSTG